MCAGSLRKLTLVYKRHHLGKYTNHLQLVSDAFWRGVN